jgi:hypothetical protein
MQMNLKNKSHCLWYSRLGRKRAYFLYISLPIAAMFGIVILNATGQIEKQATSRTVLAIIGKITIGETWTVASLISSEIYPTLMRYGYPWRSYSYAAHASTPGGVGVSVTCMCSRRHARSSSLKTDPYGHLQMPCWLLMETTLCRSDERICWSMINLLRKPVRPKCHAKWTTEPYHYY